jgi:hypothetical protein
MHGKTNRSHHFFLNFFAYFSIIGPNSDHTNANTLHQADKKPLFAQKLPLIGLFLIAALSACESSTSEETLPLPRADARSCGDDGVVQAAIFGSIETSIDWTSNEMECDSMRRPAGEGVRLRFVGDVSGERLAIIIALPDLEPGVDAVEVPSNVTASIEGSGRFFSTPNLDSCWTEIQSQTELADEHDAFDTDGTLFCITPLGEINGGSAVSIPELKFKTIIRWGNK